jgi:hypothetical protein
MGERVRVLESGTVIGGRVFKRNEETFLDSEAEARALVAEGRAAYTLRCEVLREGVILDGRVHTPGDVATASEADACRLHAAGAVRIIDVSALSDPARFRSPEPPEPPLPAEPDRFAGFPLIPVKVKAEFLCGSRTLVPSDEVEEVPEPIAVRALAAGLATADLASLSGRGRAYYKALKADTSATYPTDRP